MNIAAAHRGIAWLSLALIAAVLFAGAARAGEARFEGLVLSDAKGGAQKSAFTSKTPKIFLSGKLVDVPAGAKVKCAWIAEKTKAAPPNYLIDATEHTTRRGTNAANFALNRPTSGWPPGEYRVDLYIQGKRANSVRFSVRP